MDNPDPTETEQELAQTDRQDDEEDMRYPQHQETAETREE
jgi:hypothetical protein